MLYALDDPASLGMFERMAGLGGLAEEDEARDRRAVLLDNDVRGHHVQRADCRRGCRRWMSAGGATGNYGLSGARDLTTRRKCAR